MSWSIIRCDSDRTVLSVCKNMSHVRLQRHFKREPILSVLLVVILLASLYTFLLHLPTRAREWFSPRCNYSMKIIGNQIEFDDATYHIEHYPEFICPQNFRNLADWIYGWPSSLFKEELETSANSFIRTVPDLPQGSIIFVKMAAMESFFSKVYPSLKNPFVLVTAQGDEGTPGSYITYLDDPNSKIIHWFGQNGGINATRSARFTHIPIGKCMHVHLTKCRKNSHVSPWREMLIVMVCFNQRAVTLPWCSA